MKFRIVQRQQVESDGTVGTWFAVQYKGWLFWRAVRRWCDNRGGGYYVDCNFDTLERAQKFVDAQCRRLCAVKEAKKTVVPKVIISERECG